MSNRTSTPQPGIVERLAGIYRERFGDEPTVYVYAPGRTEIIGNHTDHNNGRVVAGAVGLGCTIVAGPASQGLSRLVSTGYDSVFSVDATLDTPPPDSAHDTERLMAGVAAGVRSAGIETSPYSAVAESTVPGGSGLSSSAAFCVSLAGMHAALAGRTIPALDAARAGKFAENSFMGKPSGLMDQLASASGGLVTIDFAQPDAPRVEPLPFRFSDHGYALAVIDTGGDHADLTGEYAAIPREMHAVAHELGSEHLCEISARHLIEAAPALRRSAGDRAFLRALHFAEEQERVLALVECARSGDAEGVLAAMRESGLSSWRLLQNVSVSGAQREQGVALALAVVEHFLRARGARGAVRVHGGGFAGTILTALPTDLLEDLAEECAPLLGANALTELSIESGGVGGGPIAESPGFSV